MWKGPQRSKDTNSSGLRDTSAFLSNGCQVCLSRTQSSHFPLRPFSEIVRPLTKLLGCNGSSTDATAQVESGWKEILVQLMLWQMLRDSCYMTESCGDRK